MNKPSDGPEAVDLLATAQEEPQKPLSALMGAGGGDELPGMGDPLAERPGRRLSPGSMLLLVVLAAAGGAIYLMRVTQPQIVAAASSSSKNFEARVEEALAKLSRPDSMAGNDPLRPKNLNHLFDIEAVIALFATDHTEHQVPLENLRKNPFCLWTAPRPAAPTASADPAPPNTAAAAEALTRRLQQEAGALKLGMIATGLRPMAQINGQNCHIGERIGSFTVKAIDNSVVDLECQGVVISITPGSGK